MLTKGTFQMDCLRISLTMAYTWLQAKKYIDEYAR